MAHVQGFEGALEAVFLRRDRHQMNVVIHQAIGENVDPVLAAIRRQPAQVADAIVVGEEHRLAAISALGDVMGNTGNRVSYSLSFCAA